MKPQARIQASIDLIDAIRNSNIPADLATTKFLRNRRYMGSHDRRQIADRTWQIIRYWARLSWCIQTTDGAEPNSRNLVLANLTILEGLEVMELQALFNGEQYAPHHLTSREIELVERMTKLDLRRSGQPAHVDAECPAWIWPYFKRSFGQIAQEEVSALSVAAPVHLRVNTLKGNRATARSLLAKDGMIATNTSLAPFGLRLETRTPLGRTEAFSAGLVEVQDEGSQIAALLTDVQRNHVVCDLCAGGGGKTLALAASMGNRGRIIACDSSKERLSRARKRLKRAGVFNTTTRILEPNSGNWLRRRARSFDRVLIDAPCSSTGTWRRNPYERWRLRQSDMLEHINKQNKLVAKAAPLVKPGGRIVYVTCSLLREENEDRIEAFIRQYKNFSILPVKKIWHSVFGTHCPSRDSFLRLSPRLHGTDGFFVAILERGND